MDILNNKVDDLKDLLIEDILDIVKIPSVKGKATNGFPFGENVAKALNKALEISEKLGFKTKNLDNYIGYADYGDGDDYICIIGHIDVVQEEDGWTYPPYSGNIENGNIYARGVLDNKGEWGVATNIEGFSFSVATKEEAPTVYVSKVVDGKTIHEVASKEWLDADTKRINAPINIE